MIDIVVMTKDDGCFLEQCVNSILETVSVEYRIFIVDNASSTPLQLDILSQLEENESVQVIRNRYNLWVLGLNELLERLYKEGESEYFFLTDADITFPHSVKGMDCWLDYLVNKMDSNACIGKLGMSLDWGILEENEELDYILHQEKSLYNSKRMISELHISPVDTTAAIYRWNWSIAGGFKFYPLHMSYLRPELYSCRTPRSILAVHLGWELYCKNREEGKIHSTIINSKVLCFSVVAGDIKKTTLDQASVHYKYMYYLFKTPMKIYWAFKRIAHGVVYHVKNSLRQYDNT